MFSLLPSPFQIVTPWYYTKSIALQMPVVNMEYAKIIAQ